MDTIQRYLPLILQLIPVLSLVVAVLAVIFGPLLAWYATGRQVATSLTVANKQIQASLAVANKQILAPMRQAWINSLRDCLAELSSCATNYFNNVDEDPTGSEYQKLHFLSQRIELMVNTNEEDHRKLLDVIATMLAMLKIGSRGRDKFIEAHKELIPLSRRILKCEWDRVKEPVEEKKMSERGDR